MQKSANQLIHNQPVNDHIKNQKTCEAKSSKYLPLPIRPKKKKYTNRAGEFASIMRNQYNVHVNLPNIPKDTCENKENAALNKRKRTPQASDCKKK